MPSLAALAAQQYAVLPVAPCHIGLCRRGALPHALGPSGTRSQASRLRRMRCSEAAPSSDSTFIGFIEERCLRRSDGWRERHSSG